ncbi:hypothetical protein Cgig2_000809 [Carnegiea gigantea]|uniref:Protein kinase domain-containing protein n=1 Tax=Carnegiea gigantea TaxID=171969 RepID=A0A9Q1GNH1_9CARY|nr:hypothetical protein Cgig2_000809 [Carnegiea gigantea]
MGCLCSKGSSSSKHARGNHKDKDSNNSSPLLSPSNKSAEISLKKVKSNGDESIKSKPSSLRVQSSRHNNSDFLIDGINNKQGDGDQHSKTVVVERPSSSHQNRAIESVSVNGGPKHVNNKIISMPNGTQGELVVAGWPSWLSSVAPEAIQGWIGQGTYSSVYKANDLETGKVVAMKKVRFFNMDQESVRFMAREIVILRRLDHPNIMKLECIVTSRMSGSLYLVFEYVEHDLAGLLANPAIKFTEPQVKCYVQQLLHGLEHCHSRGVLHRDIKGSNLLVNNDGVLKVGDFGLATFFKPDEKQPLTSRVVTLWYRAPELLLGSTNYDITVDMWSVGCIVAELFVGKPIMPGRTEVEQMHKIFKLCGSPSESYWRKTRFQHATSFKPQQPYKRRLNETFKDFPPSALALVSSLLSIEPEKRGDATTALKSEFFTTSPLPCDPSSLPKYPPSKELDIKLRDEEAKRKKAETGSYTISRATNFIDKILQRQKDGRTQRNVASALTDGSRRQNLGNGLPQCTSMIHPQCWGRKAKYDDAHQRSERAYNSSRFGPNSTRFQKSVLAQEATDLSSRKENVPKKSKIHYSGPLVPAGGSLEDMLKEHERQIQQAVRKSRIDKASSKGH